MTTPNRPTILEALRDSAGWSVSQLASRACVPERAIVAHERDGTPLPKGLLRKLAQAFAVPEGAILGVERIPGGRPRLLNDHDPLLMKLLRSVDPERHVVSDFDLARAAYEEHLTVCPPGSREAAILADEPYATELVLGFLESARALRVEGRSRNTLSVLARSVGAAMERTRHGA